MIAADFRLHSLLASHFNDLAQQAELCNKLEQSQGRTSA